MKKTCIFLMSSTLLLACHDSSDGPAVNTDISQKIRNMKGFELYIWDAGGKTFYTLLHGTNRNKDSAEIYDPKDAVEWPGMKIRINKIQEGQYISIKRLRADSSDVNKVRSYLEERKLKVSVQ